MSMRTPISGEAGTTASSQHLWLQFGGKNYDSILLTALQESGYKAAVCERLPAESTSQNKVLLLTKDQSIQLLQGTNLKRLSQVYRVCASIQAKESSLFQQIVGVGIPTVFSTDQPVQQIVRHFQAARRYPSYIDPMLQMELLKVLRAHREQVLAIPFKMNKKKVEGGQALVLDHTKASGSLTASECQILDSILKGKSNRKIAKDDYLSVSTVNNHVSQLTKKIRANDRTHAIKRVIELGWVMRG